MRQATRSYVDANGIPRVLTATESNVNGVRLRAVEDAIDLNWLQAEYRRRVPLWRRVLDAVMSEMCKGGAA
ncbi:MAG: hypothetical protein E6Q97_20280 [Desulfurellales bacterium]|nr:MAG: hypothetical protein E6Q97_20280 [Desulfurellales bacterium]